MATDNQSIREPLTRAEAITFLDRAVRFIQALANEGVFFKDIDEAPVDLMADLAERLSGGDVENVRADLELECKR